MAGVDVNEGTDKEKQKATQRDGIYYFKSVFVHEVENNYLF